MLHGSLMVEVLTKWLTALQGWFMLIERNSIITTYKWTYSLFIQYICSRSNDLITWCSSSSFQRMSQLDSPLPVCLSLWLSVCLYTYLSIGLFVSLPHLSILWSIHLSICLPVNLCIICLIHWMSNSLTWSIDWMTDWQIDWLLLTKWLTEWLTF